MVVPEYIERYDRIAIVTHALADLDAAAGAAALALFAAKLGKRVEIVTPGGPTYAARSLLDSFSISYREEAIDEDSEIDAVVLLDASSPARAGGWLEDFIRARGVPILIVDHHPAAEGWGDRALVDEAASSTSEILASELREADMDREIACALSMGILADTRGLSTASCRTLGLYHYLCGICGKTPEELRMITHKPDDVSETLAKLKGLQRTRIVAIGDWMVAISTAASHQSSVAQALVQVGADMGAAVGRDEYGSAGSMRASRNFQSHTGIHLGRLAEEMARELGGSGGGHPATASFRVMSGPGTAVDSLLRLLGKSLNSNVRDIV